MTDERIYSVLIVDDERFVRQLLNSFLGSKYACSTAENGEQALQELKTRQIDLVMTDIKMPGMSGLELCDIVRRSYQQTQVVIISALADSARREAAQRCGAVEFIEKPFDLKHVLNTIERVLKSNSNR